MEALLEILRQRLAGEALDTPPAVGRASAEEASRRLLKGQIQPYSGEGVPEAGKGDRFAVGQDTVAIEDHQPCRHGSPPVWFRGRLTLS